MRVFWFIAISAILVAALAAAQLPPLLIAAVSAGLTLTGMIAARRWGAKSDEAVARQSRTRPWMVASSAVVLTATLVASQLFVTSTVARADETGEVVRVVDGDTIDVSVAGTVRRIRLLNIDTPETVDPDKPKECLGEQATEYTTSRLPSGKRVTLKYDGERIDPYGRTLAAVFLGDSNISVEIAKAGLGTRVDLGHSRFLAEIDQASDAAVAKERGLFDPSVRCTAAGAVAVAEERGNNLTAAGSKASMQQLVAAATSASTVDKLLTATDPSKSSLWRLYSRAQKAQYATIFAEVRARAESIMSGPGARKRAIAIQRAEAEAKAKQVVEERARKARAAAKAAKAAAAKKAAQAREAARDRAEQSGSSTASNPSGYTGCRRYAPGGRTWEPIPCP